MLEKSKKDFEETVRSRDDNRKFQIIITYFEVKKRN